MIKVNYLFIRDWSAIMYLSNEIEKWQKVEVISFYFSEVLYLKSET